MTERKAGSVASLWRPWIRTVSLAGCLKPARASVLDARPDSPFPESDCARTCVPIALPTKKATATKPSQPKAAVFQCAALQRPARAAKFGAVPGARREERLV